MISKYKMSYSGGGGDEYDGGLWEVKESNKVICFRLIEEPFFESFCPKVMRMRKDGKGSHCLRIWGDGTYTVYPFRSGVPCYFEQESV